MNDNHYALLFAGIILIFCLLYLCFHKDSDFLEHKRKPVKPNELDLNKIEDRLKLYEIMFEHFNHSKNYGKHNGYCQFIESLGMPNTSIPKLIELNLTFEFYYKTKRLAYNNKESQTYWFEPFGYLSRANLLFQTINFTRLLDKAEKQNKL